MERETKVLNALRKKLNVRSTRGLQQAVHNMAAQRSSESIQSDVNRILQIQAKILDSVYEKDNERHRIINWNKNDSNSSTSILRRVNVVKSPSQASDIYSREEEYCQELNVYHPFGNFRKRWDSLTIILVHR